MAEILPWAILVIVVVVLLEVDLHWFARGREPSFREGVIWSIGWLVLALLVAPVVWALSSADDAITYTTVYFIERSLSLDNLFVFLLLFSYFGVPEIHRARLLFWGIVAALTLRGLAIFGGVALIKQPKAYPAGVFPSSYTVKYDPATREYTIALEGLKRH